MKVRILDEVVPAPGVSSPALDLLLAVAELGRHRIVAEGPERDGLSPRLRTWLGERGGRFRPVFQRGMRPTSRPTSRAIDLVDGASDFTSLPIRLSVDDVRWLELPVRVYVENARADWGFLKKGVPKEWRDSFEHALEHGLLEEVGGGGITEMLQVARQKHGTDARLARRSWFLFDSDADAPKTPSRDARTLAELLDSLCIPHHMLQRRAIENYVPRSTRREWVHSEPAFRPARADWMDAFDALPSQDQHHLHMKNCDPGRDPPLNQGYPPPRGGQPLSAVWTDETWPVHERDLDQDGSRKERVRLVQSLLSLVS